MPSPQELVRSLAELLVDHPERLAVRWVEGGEGGYVEVSADPADRGKIIGRRGRTIQSLRDLATAVFGEGNRRVGVELKE